MSSGGSRPVRSGSYVATGSAKDIDIVGFTPKYVKFINEDTGASAEWTDSMPDSTVVTHDTGVDAVDTANGVDARDEGFSVGTNAVINTDGETVHWVAFA